MTVPEITVPVVGTLIGPIEEDLIKIFSPALLVGVGGG